MTKKEIELATRKIVADNADIQVTNAVEWLLDYGLITWRQRTAIYDGITKARKIIEEENIA